MHCTLRRASHEEVNIRVDNCRCHDYICGVRTAAKCPGEGMEGHLFVALMRIADEFGGEIEQLMKATGLTAAQYNVLRILRGAGRAGLACREIGERMISRDPDITRLLDRMEKQQLITRERQSDDRRVVKAYATVQALEILKKLDQPVREMHKRQFRGMPATQLKMLATILQQLQNGDAKQSVFPSRSKSRQREKEN
jgi:DNA-binding MarR family transcriptional regulator